MDGCRDEGEGGRPRENRPKEGGERERNKRRGGVCIRTHTIQHNNTPTPLLLLLLLLALDNLISSHLIHIAWLILPFKKKRKYSFNFYFYRCLATYVIGFYFNLFIYLFIPPQIQHYSFLPAAKTLTHSLYFNELTATTTSVG